MTTSTAAKRGTILELGGRKLHFRPLNWATLEALQADLDRVAGMGLNRNVNPFITAEERETIFRVISTAAKASNDVDDAFLKEHVDLANLGEVMEAVFTTNGFITEDASPAVGEAQAAGSGS